MKMFWIYITGYCDLLTPPYLLGAVRRMRYSLLSYGRVMLQLAGEVMSAALCLNGSRVTGKSKICAT